MTSVWPDGFPRIPDDSWTRADLDTLALKYDTVENHGWYRNLEPTVDQERRSTKLRALKRWHHADLLCDRARRYAWLDSARCRKLRENIGPRGRYCQFLDASAYLCGTTRYFSPVRRALYSLTAAFSSIPSSETRAL